MLLNLLQLLTKRFNSSHYQNCLNRTFGATDAKKGITTAYTAETIDSEIDVLGDIVWKDRKGKAYVADCR